ncbi:MULTISPECIES: tyrosine-type recombinase/integrase [Halolamina]|uniref:tyrosine-type recombinase/integrase n=1 Tax=Halolamina TaxID=1075397 RepID=UPI001FE21C2E|nr:MULTISPECIES: tyrosine-type recombinase/integrase [Halolamina]
MPEQIHWSRKSLEELEQFYWDKIARDREADGYDSTADRPSHEWLVENGYSGLGYALREHHDTTPMQFFEDYVGLGTDEPQGFEWEIDHSRTVELLESYLQSIETRGDTVAPSTADTRRSRLATWARTYAEVNDREDLVGALTDADSRALEIDRCWATLDMLDGELSSPGSKLEYLRVARDWYGYLLDRGRAEFNPLGTAARRFNWERDEPDNPALDASQVRALHRTADSLEDRLLIVGLAGWGLRPSELAALHVSQLDLDGDDPYIEFSDGERKNGPGSVALLFGLDTLSKRIDSFDDEWNGHLFPSNAAKSGHIATSTVSRRFDSLCQEAGVTVRGETPTPKYGRRFWYSTYSEVVAELAERTAAIAADQGSDDPETVLRNYTSEAKRRELRREGMRERLAAAFEVE